MNHVYRLIWNRSLHAYVPAAEWSSARSKSGGRSGKVGTVVAALVSQAAAAIALAGPTAAGSVLPSGGQVTAGNATISSSGNTLTVEQSSSRAAINWSSFSVGSNATVNFEQPNASAVTLNRVTGHESSVIDGALNANGQVFILNSNGVLFGKDARVNTAGIVASTLNVSDADFMAGRGSFAATGPGGSIINLGTIKTTDGGYVALLGQHVSNEGVIAARLGTVALAAGEKITLNFNGNSLVGVKVDTETLNALVENKQAILADGGLVILTTQGLDAVLGGVVNNTGEIRAQSVGEKEGKIYLLGDKSTGAVEVAGTLDASAPTGGDGGFAETSAASVKVAPTAQVSTTAARGLTGTWLIDPTDYTVAASGGDMTGAQLSSALSSSNVSLSSASGASGTGGNVNINDAVSWSSNKLTLTAVNDVNVNAVMSASGSASLDLEPGSGRVNMATSASAFTGRADFNSSGTLTINNHAYTVITSLGTATSSNDGTLQGMQGALSGYFALGSNIDASATSGWNSGAGFAPVGTDQNSMFTGSFAGLGHTINNLAINRPTAAYVGLFGYVNSGKISSVGMTNAAVLGGNSSGASAGTGALVGGSYGTVYNSFSTGTIGLNFNYAVGGLVGYNGGTIDRSFSSATVQGVGHVGGLVGTNEGTLSNSYASGQVTGSNHYIGGLAGDSGGSILNSHAGGLVNGASYVGGLVGEVFSGSVQSSYATGAVTGTDHYTGGLIGFVNAPNNSVSLIIDHNYATGNVSGGVYAGGLIGMADKATISNNYSTGNVTGTQDVGGLLGNWSGAASVGTLSNSFYDAGTVTVNGGHQLTQGALYDAQYQDWFSHSLALDITHYAATLPADTGGYYNVSSVQGLQDMLGFSESNAGYNFRLNANLALPSGYSVGYFAGSFDGNYHSLSNLNITLPNTDQGLFGILPSASTQITSLGLHSVVVSGYSDVGGLVGYLRGGSVSGSYVSGSVSGSSYVGGLVGASSGSIANSYSSAAVAATSYVAGGLVGGNPGGTIDRSYAAGAVTAASYGAGLVGLQYGTVTRSYYNKSANSALTGLGIWSGHIADSAGVVTGLTTAQLSSQASFSSLDFNGTWFIYEGQTTPLLRGFLTPLTVTAGNATATYNGRAYSGGNGVVYSTSGGDGAVLGTASFSGSSQGAINAGSYVITPSGLYSDQQGYLISYAPGTLTINPLAVTIGPATGASRVYDGTSLVASSLLTITNLIAGDSVSLSGSGSLAGANAGNEALTGLGTLALNNPNYTLTGASASGLVDITPRPVSVVPVSGASRSYDGTALAGAGLLNITNVIAGDSVSLSGSATLAGSAAGPENLVDLSGLTLSNPNYTVVGGTASGSVLIVPASSSSSAPKPDPAMSIADSILTQQVFAAQSIAVGRSVNVSATAAGDGGNVVSVPSAVGSNNEFNAAFSGHTALSVLSTPDAGEPTVAVTLSQAGEMLGGASAGGEGQPEVRVPVRHNSLAQIVNGGVRLPDGVEQQFFVVNAQ